MQYHMATLYTCFHQWVWFCIDDCAHTHAHTQSHTHTCAHICTRTHNTHTQMHTYMNIISAYETTEALRTSNRTFSNTDLAGVTAILNFFLWVVPFSFPYIQVCTFRDTYCQYSTHTCTYTPTHTQLIIIFVYNSPMLIHLICLYWYLLILFSSYIV